MATYHAGDVLFGSLHSRTDLGLAPAGFSTLEEAEVDTKYEEVPGAHGSLDFTEVLTGYPVYRDREGSFRFRCSGPRRSWNAVRQNVVAKLHGRRMHVIREVEPDVYLEGRLWVEDPEEGPYITISGRFFPWKVDRYDSTEEWEWDSFNFETGVVREYGSIAVNGSYTLDFVSSPMGGSPEFYTEDSGVTVTVGGNIYTIPTGTWTVFPEIVLPSSYDTVQMTFSGSGTVSVKYRGGRL